MTGAGGARSDAGAACDPAALDPASGAGALLAALAGLLDLPPLAHTLPR